MRINKAELIRLGTTKVETTIEQKIEKYLKKHGEIKRSDLYKNVKGSERRMRVIVVSMLKNQKITQRPCDCGHTSFIKLL